MSARLTISDVRFYIEDRTPADNPGTRDLMFSDADIERAMYRAGREFNSIHPQVMCVDPGRLPASDNLFLAATAEFLYRARLHSLMRNRYDYQGGSIQSTGDEPAIAGLKELVKAEAEAWRRDATDRKVAYNVRGFYGRVG